MYATPHSWTPFAAEQAGRRVVQPDLSRWNYRHQVLEQRRLRPWQLFAGVKWLELSFHLRPRRLRRLLLTGDRVRRRQPRRSSGAGISGVGRCFGNGLAGNERG